VTWSASISGHNDDAEKDEQLARKLGEFLAAEGDAVSHASFSSGAYSGDPRLLAEQPAPVVE
jgi:hypothetical protein